MEFVCSKCGKRESTRTRQAACSCGGLWKLDFQAPKFDESLIDRDTWSLFRYRAFLPLEDDAWKQVTLGEGMTPIIPLDGDVMLKLDYLMPTLSYKDRGAAVLIAHCKSIGVDAVLQDSSGNAGNSVAAYCGRAGIRCDIYVPEGTSPKKIDMIQAHGAAIHVIEGSRDHCADVCRAAVREGGRYYASHVYNPFFYEGTKTYIYETYEQLHRIPEYLFVPLGNGTLFLGVIKALEELLAGGAISRMPQLVAIQSERCAPFAKAVEQHAAQPARVQPQPTLAEGIAIGVPMRGAEILEYIYRYHVQMIQVPEEGILEARAALARQGIYCEHTTAANYAAYQHYRRLHGPISDCLITMCGAGLKSDH
ncbi:threonine synthase [Lawsonibacter celer]|uniref:threonine synthase n=1 Tax=Lawsonibacter celer TaxID=2986526 RepID=UPI00164845E0|nr:threonine synthase [Lawsonibacter celer]